MHPGCNIQKNKKTKEKTNKQTNKQNKQKQNKNDSAVLKELN